MLFNKKNTRKTGEKKLLHKVGKNWQVVSVALLMALGGTAFASHTSHADATTATKPNIKNVNVNKNATSNNGANVGAQANAMHKQIIANNAAKLANNNNTQATETVNEPEVKGSTESYNGPEVANKTNNTKVDASKTGNNITRADRYNRIPAFSDASSKTITLGSDGNDKMNYNKDHYYNVLSDQRIGNDLKTVSSDAGYNVNFHDGTLLPSDGSVKAAHGVNSLFNGVARNGSVNSDASKIKSIDFSGVKVPNNVTNLAGLVQNMPNLTSVTLPDNFINGNIRNISGMFYNDPKLTTVDLSGQKLTNVSDASSLFSGDRNLTSVNFPNVGSDTPTFKVDNKNGQKNSTSDYTNDGAVLDNAFNGTEQLNNISDLNNFDMKGASSAKGMFANSGIHNVNFVRHENQLVTDPSGLDINHVPSLENMFQNDGNLTSVVSNNGELGFGANVNSMFAGDKNLTDVDLSNANLGNITTNWNMFANDQRLTHVNLGNTMTHSAYRMFDGDNLLETLTAGAANSDVHINTNAPIAVDPAQRDNDSGVYALDGQSHDNAGNNTSDITPLTSPHALSVVNYGNNQSYTDNNNHNIPLQHKCNTRTYYLTLQNDVNYNNPVTTTDYNYNNGKSDINVSDDRGTYNSDTDALSYVKNVKQTSDDYKYNDGNQSLVVTPTNGHYNNNGSINVQDVTQTPVFKYYDGKNPDGTSHYITLNANQSKFTLENGSNPDIGKGYDSDVSDLYNDTTYTFNGVNPGLAISNVTASNYNSSTGTLAHVPYKVSYSYNGQPLNSDELNLQGSTTVNDGGHPGGIVTLEGLGLNNSKVKVQENGPDHYVLTKNDGTPLLHLKSSDVQDYNQGNNSGHHAASLKNVQEQIYLNLSNNSNPSDYKPVSQGVFDTYANNSVGTGNGNKHATNFLSGTLNLNGVSSSSNYYIRSQYTNNQPVYINNNDVKGNLSGDKGTLYDVIKGYDYAVNGQQIKNSSDVSSYDNGTANLSHVDHDIGYTVSNRNGQTIHANNSDVSNYNPNNNEATLIHVTKKANHQSGSVNGNVYEDVAKVNTILNGGNATAVSDGNFPVNAANVKDKNGNLVNVGNIPVVFEDQDGNILNVNNNNLPKLTGKSVVLSSDWPSYDNSTAEGMNYNQKNNITSSNTTDGDIVNFNTLNGLSDYSMNQASNTSNSDSGNYAIDHTNKSDGRFGHLYDESLAYNTNSDPITLNNNKSDVVVPGAARDGYNNVVPVPYLVLKVTGKNEVAQEPVNVVLENSDGSTRQISTPLIRIAANASAGNVPNIAAEDLYNRVYSTNNSMFSGYHVDNNKTKSVFAIQSGKDGNGNFTWNFVNGTPTIYLAPTNPNNPHNPDNKGNNSDNKPTVNNVTDTINYLFNNNRISAAKVTGKEGSSANDAIAANVPKDYQVANGQNITFDGNSHDVTVNQKANPSNNNAQNLTNLLNLIGLLESDGII